MARGVAGWMDGWAAGVKCGASSRVEQVAQANGRREAGGGEA